MQAEQKTSVAWVSLDDDDNDMVRFWTYLINALDRLHPGLSHRLLPLLQSHQPSPIELILTTLINVLTTFAEPMVLILDDYHLITTQPIHASLCFLLDHLPPHVHLVHQPNHSLLAAGSLAQSWSPERTACRCPAFQR